MYGVGSTPKRQAFAHFMSLLSRLADGKEHSIEYSDPDEPETPLEGALDIFESLVEMLLAGGEENELDRDPHEVVIDIKTQVSFYRLTEFDGLLLRIFFKSVFR